MGAPAEELNVGSSSRPSYDQAISRGKTSQGSVEKVDGFIGDAGNFGVAMGREAGRSESASTGLLESERSFEFSVINVATAKPTVAMGELDSTSSTLLVVTLVSLTGVGELS